jgi:hypothetical protein
MRRILAVLFVLFLGSSCARGLNYNALEDYMAAGNCPLATRYIEEKEKSYGSNRKLLFLLDAAQINMLCGNYQKSNEYFHQAEQLAEELWTKSITRETAAFIINDYTRPYAGEDFEKALINLFSAINYLMLGDYEEALVECRRLDANLNMFNDKYERKNVYKEDAFGRYLSGMVYEAVHNLQDAYIDYYKAFNVFKDYQKNYGTPVPSLLVDDLLRVGEAVGRLDELKHELDIDSIQWLSQKKAEKLGKIVLIHFNGEAPVKEEDKIFVPTKHGPVTLAFPRFVVTPPSCRDSKLVVESESVNIEAETELVEDINSIAVKNLDDRKGRVVAKTIARAVAKQAVVDAATKGIKSKAQRDLAKLIFNIANIALERADTRSWRTLPGEIYLTRVFLPEGRYNTYVRLCGGVKRPVETVEVKAGETKFLLFETMY